MFYFEWCVMLGFVLVDVVVFDFIFGDGIIVIENVILFVVDGVSVVIYSVVDCLVVVCEVFVVGVVGVVSKLFVFDDVFDVICIVVYGEVFNNVEWVSVVDGDCVFVDV